MLDNQGIKKTKEALELDPFIDAYEKFSSCEFVIEKSEENPDFICRINNKVIGVELVKIMRNPRDAFLDVVLDQQYIMKSYDLLEEIYYRIEKKEKARKSRYIKSVKETILILQLTDGNLNSYMYYLDELKGDFNKHGFKEVWLADYSGYNEYRDIEIYCLYPEEHWGYYQRQNPNRKPYG